LPKGDNSGERGDKIKSVSCRVEFVSALVKFNEALLDEAERHKKIIQKRNISAGRSGTEAMSITFKAHFTYAHGPSHE
jgi:hypothetical protein